MTDALSCITSAFQFQPLLCYRERNAMPINAFPGSQSVQGLQMPPREIYSQITPKRPRTQFPEPTITPIRYQQAPSLRLSSKKGRCRCGCLSLYGYLPCWVKPKVIALPMSHVSLEASRVLPRWLINSLKLLFALPTLSVLCHVNPDKWQAPWRQLHSPSSLGTMEYGLCRICFQTPPISGT